MSMSYLPTGNVGNQIGNVRHVKVAAPPGGATSWSLGWGGDNVQPSNSISGSRRGGARQNNNEPSVNPYAPTSNMTPMTTEVKENNYSASLTKTNGATVTDVSYPQTSTLPTTASVGTVSSNRYANGANQNSGNFITDRPTTKVHGPPGGRSSIVFG